MKLLVLFEQLIAVLLALLCSNCVLGKECTNSFPEIHSHTFRNELLTSNNETLKKEVFSRYHLNPTDDSTWLGLLPRKILREDEDEWMMMYRKIKNSDGLALTGAFLKEVPLHDVRLEPQSLHWQAQQTNLEYLLMLDIDRLAWSFRKTAGLPTPKMSYGGWEVSDGELRGHFVG